MRLEPGRKKICMLNLLTGRLVANDYKKGKRHVDCFKPSQEEVEACGLDSELWTLSLARTFSEQQL